MQMHWLRVSLRRQAPHARLEQLRTRTWGVSLNLDRRLDAHVLTRVEVRHLADVASDFARRRPDFAEHGSALPASVAFEF